MWPHKYIYSAKIKERATKKKVISSHLGQLNLHVCQVTIFVTVPRGQKSGQVIFLKNKSLAY